MKIVTIGGGTGSPIIIKALIGAGFENITAICAAMDSGGKTGIIRSDERDKVIAVSDLLRNLLAMIPKNHSAFAEMLNFVDGRNRNLGYTIYYALLEKYNNNFLAVQNHFERLLGIKFLGQAIPISLDPTQIKFKTISDEVWSGEHELDRQAMSANNVIKMWIEPQVKATKESLIAIKNADFIIYTPGSLYGSILVNFLPAGVKQALKETKAQKILITNLTSNRNQTHNYGSDDYLKIFQEYTGLKKPFDILIAPNLSRQEFEKKYPKITKAYAREHSHFLGWGNGYDVWTVTNEFNRLRHDPLKLSKIFKHIIVAHN
ncbi:MAG: 2-phospho-L-lactate transferase CofD family protein [Patescibacteria group bacterium]